jgi:hypothetical protein
VKHVFLLSEIYKDSRTTSDFGTVVQVDVDPDEVKREDLRPWALRMLTERRCPLGLYVGEFLTERDGAGLDKSLGDEWIAWDGVYEFTVP